MTVSSVGAACADPMSLRSFGSPLIMELQICRPTGAEIASGTGMPYGIRMRCPPCNSAFHEKGADSLWLFEGEFSRIHQEMKGGKTARPAGPLPSRRRLHK